MDSVRGVLVVDKAARAGEFTLADLHGRGVVVAGPDDEIEVAVRYGDKRFFPDDADSAVWSEFFTSDPRDYTWGHAWRLYNAGQYAELAAYLPDLVGRIKVNRAVFAAENAAYMAREERLHGRSCGESVDELHGLMKGL